MQRIVRGIQVQHDLPGGTVRLQELLHEQRLDRRRPMADLVIRPRLRAAQSRFSVDLPATGAQSRRFACNLPASTAITGSWRSVSWSIRSS